MTHTKDSQSSGPPSPLLLPASTVTVAANAQVGSRSVGQPPNLPIALEEEPSPEPWTIVKKAAIAWAAIGGIGMTLGLITHHWNLVPIGLFFFLGPVVLGLAVQKIREDELRRLDEIDAEAHEDGAPT